MSAVINKLNKETSDLLLPTSYLSDYPFGEMTTAGSGNSHGFTGKELDESNLNYFCQRYYDPEIGRFMTLDPQDSPTASPYAYCGNNPLIFVDPTGEAMRVPVPPSEGGDGVGYDADWWTQYHMMKLWELHEIMEAFRELARGISCAHPEGGMIVSSDPYGTYVTTVWTKEIFKTSTEVLTDEILDLVMAWLFKNYPIFEKMYNEIGRTPFKPVDVNEVVDIDLMGIHGWDKFSVYKFIDKGYLPRLMAHEIYEKFVFIELGLPRPYMGYPKDPHQMTVDHMFWFFGGQRSFKWWE